MSTSLEAFISYIIQALLAPDVERTNGENSEIIRIPMLEAFYSRSGTEAHSVPTAKAPAGDFLAWIYRSPVPTSRVENKELGYKP